MKSITNCVLLSVLLFALGCGESGPELGEVDGVVLLDGEPVEGAYVSFLPMFPEGIEMNAATKTDADGKYRMQYSKDRFGVMLGEHQVMVSTLDDIKTPDGRNKKIPERIPAIYVNEKSPLIWDVKPGKNEAILELFTDKDKR